MTYIIVYMRKHMAGSTGKNGEIAGTTGCAKRLECIQVVLVKKGAAAPGNTQKTHVIK